MIGKSIISHKINSNRQVHCVQSQTDGGYRFTLVYQNHLTKFMQLQSLKTKRSEEVAYMLLDFLFYIFGAPSKVTMADLCNKVTAVYDQSRKQSMWNLEILKVKWVTKAQSNKQIMIKRTSSILGSSPVTPMIGQIACNSCNSWRTGHITQVYVNCSLYKPSRGDRFAKTFKFYWK